MTVTVKHAFISQKPNDADATLIRPSNWNENHVLTGLLDPPGGGTGISSYTIGDIIYASGAAVLSKLADVATGNALISGGVGAAPSWGKIGLTTHINGILPVANGGSGVSALSDILGTANQITVTGGVGRVIGGNVTLGLPQDIATSSSPTFAGMTLSGLTQGSIPFFAASGLISQDNAKLYWDNTNKKMGVGLSPTAILHARSTPAVALTGTVAVTNGSTAVTGTGTNFGDSPGEITPGDAIKIGSEIFTVQSVSSATSLTLDSPYQGATQSGLTAYKDPDLFNIENGDGVSTLRIYKEGHVEISVRSPSGKAGVVLKERVTNGAQIGLECLTGSHAGFLHRENNASKWYAAHRGDIDGSWRIYGYVKGAYAVIINPTTHNMTLDGSLSATSISASKKLSCATSGYTGVNGNNNDISITSNVVMITGPTGPFTITGIAGGSDGDILVLFNTTSQAMTIANQDVNSVAGNRIITTTGAGMATTGVGSVILVYSSTDSRWVVIGFEG